MPACRLHLVADIKQVTRGHLSTFPESGIFLPGNIKLFINPDLYLKVLLYSEAHQVVIDGLYERMLPMGVVTF